MKSQWECVLENLGEWVGSFTSVTPAGEAIEDIPSIIKLEGARDNQAIHLVLTRFYPLPNSTERYAKEVVWDFSTPPGIGAIYFETGAFSSGALAVTAGVKTIAEFSLVAMDRRFRTIQVFDANGKFDRVTFVREHRQGTTTPERPQLAIAYLLGTWQGTATTFYPHSTTPIVERTQSILTTTDRGYQLLADNESIAISTQGDRLLQFTSRDGQPYQTLFHPDAGYTTTPTQIELGHPFYVEIGWVHQIGHRQRLVRQYDSTGKWHGTSFYVEELVAE
ncbi:DUF3598 family protein [Chamaesiphon sp. GL140_3_metabinner_50]|uniref:DUF3598 family protein n=1 Tax=Chamaesiphon sp. GL140_3_metabinner_50 TaxID=2970812 RepID=UPI0025EA29D5|nr:DUF3598 family protein [Chamaesiphon sp. GL140_3_metabinner_50]